MEFKTLEKVIYAEARGEGLTGMVIVGNTVINRCKEWGGSVYEIVTSPSQFASIRGITDDMITPEIEKAARMALEWDLTAGALSATGKEGGSLYFFNPEGCGKDELLKRTSVEGVRYKRHIFYRR